MTTTIYRAAKILTMNPSNPVASHVAVRDGKVLGAGTLEELAGWGDHVLDERFADKVLMPGFVEGHAHTSAGSLWDYCYLGYFDRADPDGTVWPGLKDRDAVVARLAEACAGVPEGDLVLGWGLDPIYMDNVRLTRADLDAASARHRILVMNASGHIVNANTAALDHAGLLRGGLNHPGIPLGDDGLPMGELRSPEVMGPAMARNGIEHDLMEGDASGLKSYGRLCVRAGVTTSTDLARMLDDAIISDMLAVTGAADFPVCIVPFRIMLGMTPENLVNFVVSSKARSTDRLDLGRIKVVADGSIQGFTARLRAPGYYNGAPNGLWYVAPEQLLEIYERALKAGVLVHTHTNGDEATELAIEKLEAALAQVPVRDHRFTLQHCQLAGGDQFRRMGRLGMCVNLFANHHYYWGDEHYRYTVGPERAMRMNATRTALANGLPLAIHSDAPVTPLGPLFTAWAAVTRLTASGRLQGAHEAITVPEALYAITMGAAVTLKMDHMIGSIETGKRADFAILEADPTEVAPEDLKDVGVWGTVQGGRVFAAADV
ncbi:amidohydrolase [Falsirhodobacter algicola]|uniref:Amidohydrolase family protein n=1 Tax=Falsirhodobacter algicola TaxID=2692330 RepID=A0A8J8SKU4_9RHOB|nr:amidohydrolase [Falsirhodobacter algicola]QUS36325.1 amidohydrolase family protein [Falsirhodobacter algicola]